ncbi:MAG TPA: class II aldolase/adducin family protein [Usitatibacter sp.]|nr:class II aldolase/adducin family protein [Usitatibacter sp.]
MSADEAGLRARLVAIARRLAAAGMNTGTSGNMSARVPGGYLVTPSGVAYDTMQPGDIVGMADDSEDIGGARRPSSEWRLHRDIYRHRPEVGGVVHTHSPYATTLACLGRAIPAFHYEVALAGGTDVRCAPYATFGTQALSDAALRALEGRRACLLAQHGLVAVGASPEEASATADKVEALARLYWQVLQVGEPRVIDEAEMARVARKFAEYRSSPHGDVPGVSGKNVK